MILSCDQIQALFLLCGDLRITEVEIDEGPHASIRVSLVHDDLSGDRLELIDTGTISIAGTWRSDSERSAA